MPIRARLLLAGLAVAVLTTGLFGFALERLVTLNAPDDRNAKLAELAERAVASVRRAAPAQLRAGVAPTAAPATGATEPFTAVFSSTGRLLYSTARFDGALGELRRVALRDASAEGAASALRAGGTELRLHLRSFAGSHPGVAGIVVTGEPTSLAGEDVTGFRWFLAVSGIVALLVAALAAWVVSGRALRPLRELARTADEIGRTSDLDRRLPPRRTKDALGALTASFNGMLDRLGSAHRELEQALETQRRFVADASHELRSPLATVRSNAGFLLEKPGATAADRADALADIAAEGERMSVIVDDLLTLARAEGDGVPAVEAVPIEPVVAEAMRAARAAGRPVTLDVEAGLRVRGDAASLLRLVRILLDNAVTHGAGAIRLEAAGLDGRAVLTVADEGPGIAEADLGRVFERFYRADGARTGAGTGLGLAIARALAERHGGSITAGRGDGGGAVFTVELPLA